MTPSQAVRMQCTECLGLIQYNKTEIENCKGGTCYTGPCILYLNRLGKRVSVKTLRKFCINCMGGQAYLVADCISRTCNMYPYRMGKNPSRQGLGNSSRLLLSRHFNNDNQRSAWGAR